LNYTVVVPDTGTTDAARTAAAAAAEFDTPVALAFPARIDGDVSIGTAGGVVAVEEEEEVVVVEVEAEVVVDSYDMVVVARWVRRESLEPDCHSGKNNESLDEEPRVANPPSPNGRAAR
jgi:hypothetical protein